MAQEIKKEETQKRTVYEIRVTAKRFKNSEYDFLTFTGYNKKGKKFTMKFTQDCEGIPEQEGEYIISVEKKFINEDKANRYLTYWVKEIIACEEFEGYVENTEDLDFEGSDLPY